MRILLIAIGVCILIVQQFLYPLSVTIQFVLFIAGIVLLGIPHGAADLLVANENTSDKKNFSAKKFHISYIARLSAFALLFWFFPVITNFLFIGVAAFHFGETDLIQFDTSKRSGKFFTVSYGVLLLFVIIIPHFETLKPLFALFPSGLENELLIGFIDSYRNQILGVTGVIFMIITIWYLVTNPIKQKEFFLFSIEFIILLLILYYMPLLLGFTFYFVMWHSIFSLKNIFKYLCKNGNISYRDIAKQIGFYSLLSFAGFSVFALTGLLIVNSTSLTAYIFIMLAILTAPHMQVMHNMYSNIKKIAVR